MMNDVQLSLESLESLNDGTPKLPIEVRGGFLLFLHFTKDDAMVSGGIFFAKSQSQTACALDSRAVKRDASATQVTFEGE